MEDYESILCSSKSPFYCYDNDTKTCLPPLAWLMAVQTFMTIALLASMTTLVTVSLVLIRWPMQTILRFEWHLTGFCFLCQAVTGKFGGFYRQDPLLYISIL